MRTILLELLRRKRKRPMTPLVRYVGLAQSAVIPVALAASLQIGLGVPFATIFFGTWAGLVLLDHIYGR